MNERRNEKPSDLSSPSPAWRKKILREMFKGLEKPLFREKTWEMLFDERSKEYSFMVGNTILFVDENGNPLGVKVLENGRVRPSTQIVKMTTLMDHALNHYAQKRGVRFPDEEDENEEEPFGLTVDVEPENPQPEEQNVIKRIRRRLKL